MAPSKSFLPFTDGAVKSRSLLMGDARPDFIPDGDEVPYAVALVRFTSNALFAPIIRKMTRTNPFISLDDPHLMELLRDSLEDIVIYGRGARTDGCTVFTDLYPPFSDQHYLLREYDTSNGDYSLNRCTIQTDNFLPRSFQLGPPTVLQENSCNNDFTPIIELYAAQLSGDNAPEAMETDDSPVPGPSSGSCKPRSFDQQFYDFLSEERVNDLREEGQRAPTCPANDGIVQSVVRAELDIDSAHVLLKKVFGENVPLKGEFEWDSDAHFKEEWLTFIAEHPYMDKIMPRDILQKKEVRNWFVFKPNEQVPAMSSFYCKQCEEHYDEMHFSRDRKSDFATKRGLMRSTKSRNRVAIRDHATSTGHLMVINGLKKRAAAEIPVRLFDAQKYAGREGTDLHATMNHFRAVFIAVCKHNVAFHAYEDMVLMMKLNGLDMGKHFGNRNGAAAITSFISEHMHEKLLKHIIDSQMDFGLIVDETTSKSHTKYFAVLIQGLEDERPITYFYRNIEIHSVTVTAQDLFKHLMEAFEEDNIRDAARGHLVGFASDGASGGQFNRHFWEVPKFDPNLVGSFDACLNL